VRRLLDACSDALDTPPAAGPGLARLAGVRILAAEDNEVNRLVLQEALSGEGAALTVVGNGRALLERLQHDGATAYDVVLTDIQMPEMDGYEAARHMAALAPELPVIGLTARAMAEERSRCLAAGMREHVAKPIDFDLLVGVILRHCRPRPAHGEAPGAAGESSSPPAASRAAQTPSAAAVDWEALHARYPGKSAFIAKLLAMTVSAYADTPEALRAAARNADHDALAFIAHGLKGVGGNIAAASLREHARRTEEAARKRGPDAADCAERLAEDLERVLAQLARHAGSDTHTHTQHRSGR